VKWFFVVVWCLVQTAFAQVSEKWYLAALARSDSFAIAQSEVQNAKQKLARVKSDPLLTKPVLLEATTVLELSEARLVSSKLEVRRALFVDVFAWQSATDALEFATAKQDLADANQKAAVARFKTGAVTSVEVNRAEADLRAARSETVSAGAELAAALEVLQSRLGFKPDAKTPSDATPRPSKALLERNVDLALRIVEQKGNLARAKLNLEIVDNEYSAAVEIAEAKRVVSNTERNLAEARALTRSSLTSRWEAHQTALSALATREQAVGLAMDELKTQNERFSRGLVSKLVVLQARVGLLERQVLLQQSRQRLAYGVLELAQLVNLNLWAN
jgi:outer membrane protein TolC